MIDSYNVVDTILFSESSTNIAEKLRSAKKDYFEPNDRIVIVQDVNDTYPYIDAAGSKLIELQNDWLDQRLFSINDLKLQVLTSPDFLSPAMLPSHHKQRLSSIIKEHIQDFEGTKLAQQWTDVIQWMNNNDFSFARKEFADRTRVLDQHRNESFETIFPEFIDLI